jgi:hypothetical protein
VRLGFVEPKMAKPKTGAMMMTGRRTELLLDTIGF